jgi:hypothetical protein
MTIKTERSVCFRPKFAKAESQAGTKSTLHRHATVMSLYELAHRIKSKLGGMRSEYDANDLLREETGSNQLESCFFSHNMLPPGVRTITVAGSQWFSPYHMSTVD